MLRRTLFLGCLVCVFSIGGPGCGSSDPKPIKVSGTVTLDGQPLPDAMVTFLPVEKDGQAATGMTDSQGVFSLTTHTTDDGANAGDYKVIVKYSEAITEDLTGGNAPDLKSMFSKFQKTVKDKKKGAPRFVVPKKYSEPAKSGLRQRVPPDGPVTIELKSK